MCLILLAHGQLFKDVSTEKKILIELGMNIEMVLANEDFPRYVDDLCVVVFRNCVL